MAELPRKKPSTAKKKIASTQFPKAKRKISSRKIANKKKATTRRSTTDTPLDHPTDEQSRQDAVAILKDRMDALSKAKKNPKAT